MRNSNFISRSFGTHNGTFHADEVTACALLLLYNLIDSDKITRSRDLLQLMQCEYVCDVGGIYDISQKLFDHHQAEYKNELSSAGMILLYLKDQGIISSSIYHYLNSTLVHGIDQHDIGKAPQLYGVTTFSHVISNFTPIEYEATDQEQTTCFMQAVEFAYQHIKRLIERYQYTQSCRKMVESVMQSSTEYLLFEKNIPWQENFFDLGGENHPALFVIMPSGKHWKLRGIPPNPYNLMQVRCPLPEEWAGLLEENLKKQTGIAGAIFCHKGRFISVWETKEDALKALQYVINYSQNKGE